MDIINDFLYPLLTEGFLVVIVCYLIGYAFKKLTPSKLHNLIPVVCGVSGMLIAVFIPMITGTIPVKLIKGLILGIASTGGYEFIRNIASYMTKNNIATEKDTNIVDKIPEVLDAVDKVTDVVNDAVSTTINAVKTDANTDETTKDDTTKTE